MGESRLKAATGCATVKPSLNVSKLMAKKTPPRTFADALATLAGHQFDVASARDGAGTASKAFQVRKYGCAAEIAAAPDGTTMVLARPGWMLGGQIARLVDRGYQKFLKTPSIEIPATADLQDHRGGAATARRSPSQGAGAELRSRHRSRHRRPARRSPCRIDLHSGACVMHSKVKYPTPQGNPETKEFWEQTVEGKLLIKRCTACGEPHYFPRTLCPFCFSDKTDRKST